MHALELACTGFEHVITALTGATCEIGLGPFTNLGSLTTDRDSGRRALAPDDGEYHDAKYKTFGLHDIANPPFKTRDYVAHDRIP